MRKWAYSSLTQGRDHILEVNRLLLLCIQGLLNISKLPDLALALSKIDWPDEDNNPPPSLEERTKVLDETIARSKLAQTEIDRGFPILHANTLIAIWGILEALVTDLAVSWLLNEPRSLENDAILKIKIPLAQYELLSQSDRIRFLVKELSRSLSADFKPGIAKFEVVLDALGLSGPVDDEIHRTLFELSQIRNVIVHRAGLVDRQFKESCPSININIDEKLYIDHTMYVRYFGAVCKYLQCLYNRVRILDGLTPYVPKTSEEPKDK